MKYNKRFKFAILVIIAFYSTNSKAAASFDSPTLLYSNNDISSANRMAKRGTYTMYAINIVAMGTVAFKQDKEGVLQYAETMISSQLITEIGKDVTHRQRPDHSDYKSLPSGHASGSFAPAAFMYYRYGAEYGVPAFIAASFVSYTRVEARKHYISDTVVGAAVGVLSAKYFTTKIAENDMQITPTASAHDIGISVSVLF